MIKQKFTNLQENILRFLFINSGKSFNARTLAIKLNVSQTAISKSIHSLKKERLILVDKNKFSKQLNITLNSEISRVIGLKRAENLKLLYECGLPEFLEEKFPGCTIILFGSYSFGEDTFDSDIDLAIIGSKSKDIKLDKFEKILEKEIRINFYKNINEIEKNFKSNLFNGIILTGGIDL